MSTYTPIAYTTTTSSASSVILSNIPQTYTDLVLVLNFSLSGNNEVNWKFNSDTGTNYSRTYLDGGTTSTASGRQTNNSGYDSLGRTTRMIQLVSFNNYSNTTTYKTVIHRYSAGGSSVVGAQVGLWRSTSAISTIGISLSAGTFTDGSTFNLYGIDAQASAQAKATGGSSITTDGTYWYHTFYSSGTFTPTEAITADYLVVAGGGGGGRLGGGGGAGGFRTSIGGSGLSLTASTNYTVTVGSGGAGGTAGAGSAGSDSVFSSITSTGGGYGGEFDGGTGGNGGSGGGAGADSTSPAAAGGSGNTPSTSPSQGNNGGTAFAGASGSGSGGGGGGASAVGSNGTSGVGGNGGAGTASSITGSSVTYAGGGGGGAWNGSGSSTGGAGGGGAGTATNTTGTAGTANLGGGGGAGGFSSASGYGSGAAGGSGIVVIRYAV